MRIFYVCLPMLVMFAALFVAAPAAAGLFQDKVFAVEVTSNIEYDSDNGLLLDVYAPTGPNVPALKPGFVFVHGGGWAVGSKDGPAFTNPLQSGDENSPIQEYAAAFAERGYVCVSIDYRLLGDGPSGTGALDSLNMGPITLAVNTLFGASYSESAVQELIEAAAEDTEKATDWMLANAAGYGIDPDRVAVGGYSAGAFSALLAGYLDDGPTKVRAIWSNSGSFGGGGNEAIVLGNAVNAVPVIAFHGDNDDVLPFGTFGAPLLAALAGEVIPHAYYTMGGEDHYYLRSRTVTEAAAKAVPDNIENLVSDFMYSQLELEELDNTLNPPVATPLSSGAGLGILLVFFAAMGRYALRRNRRCEAAE